jgi:hypothetical protein
MRGMNSESRVALFWAGCSRQSTCCGGAKGLASLLPGPAVSRSENRFALPIRTILQSF